MSHFATIVDTVRFEYFGLGRCCGALYEFYDLAMMAMPDFPAPVYPPNEHDLSEFRKLLPPQWDVDPIGLKRLYCWLQGQGLAQFVHDDQSRDSPMVLIERDQYWRCVGSLFRPEEEDIFDHVGYLSINHRDPRWTPFPKNRCAGSQHACERDGWQHYLKLRKFTIPGLYEVPV